jgi:hypothetical protein
VQYTRKTSAFSVCVPALKTADRAGVAPLGSQTMQDDEIEITRCGMALGPHGDLIRLARG